MSVEARIFTFFNGREAGRDEFGNRYFVHRKDGKRRWVLYKGIDEASKVPPGWHRWLHHKTDETPDPARLPYAWEKPHLPNLSGTKFAYVPPGHVLRGEKRKNTEDDYTPWQPPEK